MLRVTPIQLVTGLAALVISLTVHEAAHALAAWLLGDETARRAGRLTLNPIPHVDPVGTLLLPFLAAASGAPLFGWAKPCPVDPSRFRRGVPRHLGHAFVAAAGPLSNLALAVLTAIAATHFAVELALEPLLRRFVSGLFTLNLLLCVFNLLPIHPLDGSRLLPASWQAAQRRLGVLSALLFLAVLLVPAVSQVVIGMPVAFLEATLREGLGLAVPRA